MGKAANAAIIEQEFAKLQAQLHQSAQDTVTYLEALKRNLADYDHKYHLHLSSSATSFFDDGLDHAREVVKQLKHTADHIRKDAGVAEADAARAAMEQTFNALADLHKVANAFDTEHPAPVKRSGKKPTTSDSMEWLVSTTRDASFCGFAVLQRQIVAVLAMLGEGEKPSIKDRAKDAVHHVADKIKGDLKLSPKSKKEKPTNQQETASAHSV